MSRRSSSTRNLVIAGALVLLLSSSSADGSSWGAGTVGKRPPLPKPLGDPPSSSAVVDVDRPTVTEYSAADMAALRERAEANLTSSPLGTVKASPELEPRHGRTPAGYDPAQARARAQEIAGYLAKKGPKGYSRDVLKSWQRLAGLHVDGVYAGSTRGALVFYGVPNPPRPYAAPVATLPYHPPDFNP